MSSATALHALSLHFFRPAGNLRTLLREDPATLAAILRCYARLARDAHKYAGVARLHVALAPLLLEQLRAPELVAACRDIADLPAILDGIRSATAIELVGTGYRHAPLPLIPPDDWDEQLGNERALLETELGRVPKGYWPPAGLCVPEMVPALVRAGYEYLLLPAAALAMPDGGGVDPYRAYRLCHRKSCISVVPLDPGFSQAQERGLDAPWFADSVRSGVARAPASEAPYLLSTWSDGGNGEWFRSADEERGFFGRFFAPYMEFCETGEFPVRPVFLSEYLRRFRPRAEVGLRSDFGHGAGALDETLRKRLFQVSGRYWSLVRAPAEPLAPSPQKLLKARALLLDAEDSEWLLGDASARQQSFELLARAERLMATGVARRPAAGMAKDREAAAPEKRPVVPKTATRKGNHALNQGKSQPATNRRSKKKR